MNNYHWYLKHSFEFLNATRVPVSVVWDAMDASILYMLLSDGSLSKYCIGWVTNANACPGSDAETAVVDGSKCYHPTSTSQDTFGLVCSPRVAFY